MYLREKKEIIFDIPFISTNKSRISIILLQIQFEYTPRIKELI